MNTFNSASFNTVPFDYPGVSDNIIVTMPEQIILSVEQTVGIVVDESIIVEFYQDVELLISLPEQIIVSFEQEVQFVQDETIICEFNQRVIDYEQSFLQKYGWDISIVIAGEELSKAYIHGNITIIFEENQSNLCDFTILVSDPISFINSIWGEDITIDYYDNTGVQRLFTGIVDMPEIDLILKTVKLNSTNRRDEIVNNTMSSSIKTIGRYAVELSGPSNNVIDELNERLKTVALSVDFDQYNTLHLNSWFTKVSPDYVYTGADIYHRKPRLKWQDRSKVINDVTVKIDYQFTRLYHYQRDWYWRAPFADSVCDFLASQYSLLNIKMVEDAINGAKWRQIGDIIFEGLWPPRLCADGAILLVWSPSQSYGNYNSLFDDKGDLVSDPSGLALHSFTPFDSKTDLSLIYTLSASWTASTRFSQNITEHFKINVVAPQSINQFGNVTDSSNVTISKPFDASQWEAYEYFTSAPIEVIAQNGSYFINQDIDSSTLANVELTCIDRAKTKILSTHRETQLDLEMYIKPNLTLSHTVQYNSDLITAKGKVSKIIHTIDVENRKDNKSEVTISMFRSQGSTVTETPTITLSRIDDPIFIPSPTIVLPSTYGEEPTPATIGYIGNKNNPSSGFSTTFGEGGVISTNAPIRTTIQEEFRIDTPAIIDSLRANRDLDNGTTTFNINIPDDLIEVNFG